MEVRSTDGETTTRARSATIAARTDPALLAEVARRYYLDDESKVDIGRSLGLSRFKVARLLDEARRSGVVRIRVGAPATVDPRLSAALQAVLPVDHCVVVASSGSFEDDRRHVAGAAAALLPGAVPTGGRLGLTWSRAVDAVVDELAELPRCTVVQLAGALAPDVGGASAADHVHRAARLAGGTAHSLHAPLVVDDETLATALRRQRGVREAIALADDLDVSVVSVGAWRPGGSTVWEAVPEAVRSQGACAGAVAEVSGRLLDAAGGAVRTRLDDLVVAVTLDQLRRPPVRVALVSGPDRAAATVAGVRAGLVTHLVTTSVNAHEVLQLLG
ncbi:sugar-binding domain-containing protein [Thalassiella azotivora]